MLQYYLLTILFFLVIGYIIFKIVKKIFATIILVIILFLIVSFGVSYSAYNSILDIKNSDKAFSVFYLDNDKILAGFKTNLKSQESTFFSYAEINQLSAYYREENLDVILGDSIKLIFVKEGFIGEASNETINLGGYQLTNDEVVGMIESEDPILFYVLKHPEAFYGATGLFPVDREIILNSFGAEDHVQLKGLILSRILIPIITNPKGWRMVFESYSNKNLIIYPQPFSLKLFKFVPNSLTYIL